MRYQHNYASIRPQMYDWSSRVQKARRMIKTLSHYFGRNKLSNLRVLDIGSSTGIIANTLAPYFKTVIGIDLDKPALKFARKQFKKSNLQFHYGDATQLPFPDNSFGVVICAQIYEHVSDSKKLFSEIYRVLKPGGVCYLAAINSLWPMEPHYNLPFLSYIPKPLANFYIKLTKKGDTYYEHPESYWGLEKLTKIFKRIDYTDKILKYPKRFGYEDVLNYPTPLIYLLGLLSPILKYFVSTFFWILKKES